MPLEPGVTYLNDLVETNPTTGDPKTEGDDHLRNIKAAIKNTFPNLTGRSWRTISTAVNRAVTVADNMTVIEVTAGATITPDAAATLGNGHMFFVKSRGGDATIDPNGAEVINGQTTHVVKDGFMSCVLCDGTRFGAITAPYTFAKGDVVVYTATGPQKLAVGGTDGFLLQVDAAQALGIKWAALPGGVITGSAYTMNTGKVLGRTTASAGAIEELGAAGLLAISGGNITTNISAASKLVGRGSASGAGVSQEITLGTNLSMSGTTLNASGGVGTDIGVSGVGMISLLRNNSGGSLASAATVAGSSLKHVLIDSAGNVGTGASTPAGTWRNISNDAIGASEWGTFQRIS